MTHRHVEARTIRERDNDDFPTEFAVRHGFRPEADPFTGYTTGATAAFAWKVIGLSLAAIAAFVLLYNAVHPHMVVPQ